MEFLISGTLEYFVKRSKTEKKNAICGLNGTVKIKPANSKNHIKSTFNIFQSDFFISTNQCLIIKKVISKLITSNIQIYILVFVTIIIVTIAISIITTSLLHNTIENTSFNMNTTLSKTFYTHLNFFSGILFKANH